jgi:hypothetical protein
MSTSPNAYGASANPIGTSTGATSPWGDNYSRSLTSGEIALAQTIFKDGVDYNTVKVHNEGYLWFGMQPPGSGMTPKGEMFITENQYQDRKSGNLCFDHPTYCTVQIDYSAPNIQPRVKSLFIHEMVHIWQFQLGFSVIWHGLCTAISGGYSYENAEDEKEGKQKVYKYTINATQTKFSDFNFEQQGDIISDYYLATAHGEEKALKKLAGLRSILSDFLTNPNDKKLLPK